MARRPTRDLAIGALFALALIVLALGVMAVGGEVPWFSQRAHFVVVFPEAGGLLLGAPVRIAGVDVGTVSNIYLPTDPGERGIEVEIAVDRAYTGRIRIDSRAALRILQLLTNEKFVEITPGAADQPELPPDSRIQLLAERGYLEQGAAIAENLSEITAALRQILTPLEKGEGLLGKIIQDPEFGLAGLEALGGAARHVEELTADIKAGKGAVGRLLYDEQLASRLDDLGNAAQEFSELMRWASERRAAIEPLLAEDGDLFGAVEDIRATAASFRELGRRLEAGEGLLGQLLAEKECARSLGDDLCATFRNLSEVTGKINRGEGTLGALVNERVLHDSAEDVVAGVNDSKFARWLTRHYRKKGIKAQDREEGAEPRGPDGD